MLDHRPVTAGFTTEYIQQADNNFLHLCIVEDGAHYWDVCGSLSNAKGTVALIPKKRYNNHHATTYFDIASDMVEKLNDIAAKETKTFNVETSVVLSDDPTYWLVVVTLKINGDTVGMYERRHVTTHGKGVAAASFLAWLQGEIESVFEE